MPTLRTLTRCIARVNGNYLDACQFRLVLDVSSKLPESPAMQFCVPFASSPNPLANIGQVFQYNRLLCALRLLNDLLADAVILVFGKALLFAGKLFQSALGRLRTLALQPCAHFALPLSQIANMRAGKTLPGAVGGDASNAEVNAEHSFGIVINRRLNYVARHKQEPLAFAKHEVRFALPIVEQLPLLRAADEGDSLPSVNRPNRNVIRAETQDAVIVGNRAVNTENPLLALVELVGISNFRNHPDGNLSRQTELLTDGRVRQFVNLKLTKGFGLPRQTRGFIRGGICQAKRFPERVSLFFRWQQFNPYSQLHGAILTQSLYI